MHKLPSNFICVLFSMLLIIYGYSCMNMFLPAIPYIAKYFNSSLEELKLSVSYFLIALGVGQLFWGLASEHLSRFKILLYSSLISMTGSVVTALSVNAEMFIIGRVIEAFGVGSAVVYARLVLADYLQGTILKVNLSRVVMVAAILPGIAPVIGGYILVFLSWRDIFWLLFIIGLIALISGKQVYSKHEHQPVFSLNLKRLFDPIKNLLKTKHFISTLGAYTSTMTILINFYAIAPFILITNLHISATVYGYALFFICGAYLIGALGCGYLSKKNHSPWVVWFGYSALILGVLLLFLFSLFSYYQVISILISMIFVAIGCGFLSPTFNALALEIAGNRKSIASGLLPSGLMAFCGLCSSILSPNLLASMWTLTIFVAILTCLSFYFYVRTRKL